jgi:ethanolaminephosphotransferase
MSAITQEFHEITTGGGGDPAAEKNADDVRHQVPSDKSHVHVWMVEAAIAHDEGRRRVLTQDGITQIAVHKYHAGQNTILDGILNPIWAYLTECLPLTMAPNLVTLLGGAHCLAAYLITWYFTTDFNASSSSLASSSSTSGSSSSRSTMLLTVAVVPCWVLFANAYGQMAYYTLDCMDGKQARRTKSSSPVGQLFDHGIDCLCLLAHLSSVHAYLGWPPAAADGRAADLSFLLEEEEESMPSLLFLRNNPNTILLFFIYNFAALYFKISKNDRFLLDFDSAAAVITVSLTFFLPFSVTNNGSYYRSSCALYWMEQR